MSLFSTSSPSSQPRGVTNKRVSSAPWSNRWWLNSVYVVVLVLNQSSLEVLLYRYFRDISLVLLDETKPTTEYTISSDWKTEGVKFTFILPRLRNGCAMPQAIVCTESFFRMICLLLHQSSYRWEFGVGISVIGKLVHQLKDIFRKQSLSTSIKATTEARDLIWFLAFQKRGIEGSEWLCTDRCSSNPT